MGQQKLATFVFQYPSFFFIGGDALATLRWRYLRTEFLPLPGCCRSVGKVAEQCACMAFTKDREWSAARLFPISGQSQRGFASAEIGAIQAAGEVVEHPAGLPAWRLDREHELVQHAASAVQAAGLPPTIGTWRFCTNGSESAGRRHIPTIGLGSSREEGAHSIDESIEISQLEDAREIYRNLTLALAGA